MSLYKSIEVQNAAKFRIVDMRSDTVTLPTPQMREAMATADVGDDVYGEDPTVVELEHRCAEILGKEAALFVPSGTMGNLLAVMVHCNQRSAEAIIGDQAHGFLYEQGSAAHIAGVSVNIIKNNPDGTFDLDEFLTKIRGHDIHEPRTTMVMIENTHNMCGGKVLPLDWIEKLSVLARENGLKIHMDGARIFNAAAALSTPPHRVARDVDSINFCLSKGLACPVGSMLVGTKDFIREAHRYRKALGGGMRQVGVLAAAGLVALDQVVPLLKYDNERAKTLANAIHKLNSPTFSVDIANVQTNIFMIDILNQKLKSQDFVDRLLRVTDAELKNGIEDSQRQGIIVKCGAKDSKSIRIVTHIQIDDELIALAIKKINFVINEFDQKE